MGSSAQSGRRTWRAVLAGVAAAALATPFITAAAVPATTADPQPSQERHLLSVAGEDLAGVTADVTRSGGQVLQAFPVASAMVVTLPEGAAVPAGTVAVPDQKFTFNGAAATDAPVNTYRETIRATSSLTGDGVTVALVDTGVADTGEIDVTHVNVSGAPLGDGLGHGTFLAGLIAGDGTSSDGAYMGVAPGAKVLDVQVADAAGATSLTQVLAGLQAVADRQANDPSVKVVQLALSTGSPLPPWLDPLTRGLETLWARGMTVVVAAGNNGADKVTAPASDPTLLAVGSIDEQKTADRADDAVADFSSYGQSFGAERPDLVAPGVSLVSLRAPGSIADNENPNSRIGEKYFKGTGTSMSSAVAAGAAAALLAVRPQLRPNDVKRLLVGTALSSSFVGEEGEGAGGLDLTAAVQTNVADTPKLKFENVSTRYAPAEEDAEAWAEFSKAWEEGDLKAVVAAWIKLSPQTRRWAANSWSLAVLARSLTLPEGDFAARRWAARRWVTQRWDARRWAEDGWVARRWVGFDWDARRWVKDEWNARRWVDESWNARRWVDLDWNARRWVGASWEARRWVADDWLSFAWTLRVVNDDDAVAGMWNDEDWAARRWVARRWVNLDWVAGRWAAEAWDARRWADYVWDARRWVEFVYEARRWVTEDWAARRWAVTGWGS